MKSSGQKIDPCGTPHLTLFFSDSTYPILKYWSLSDRIQSFSEPFFGVRSVHAFSAVAHGTLYQKLFLDQEECIWFCFFDLNQFALISSVKETMA